MATRTLKFKYEAYDEARTYHRENLCYTKDRASIYYEITSDEPAKESQPESQASQVQPVIQAPIQMVQAPVQSRGPVTDSPVSSELISHVIVAQKMKKGLGEIPLTKSIKELAGGKR